MKVIRSNIITYSILFAFLCFLCLPSIIALCNSHTTLGFDTQALIFWKYAAEVGSLPYKDIFYPYGLLLFYAGQNNFINFIYLLVSPISLLFIFYIFQRVFGQKYFVILAFTFLVIFIIYSTGFETFIRYGSLTAAALLLVPLLQSKGKRRQILILSYGLFIGLLFPWLNDIGFYIPQVFLLTVVISTVIIRFTANKNIIKKSIVDLILFTAAFVFGLIPFIAYLIYTQSIDGFISTLLLFKEVASFAKTPFFHSISSMDNIFVIATLLAAITVIGITTILQKQRLSNNRNLQIVLVILLLILEQKNIVRSIDTQITFLGFILFVSLFYDFMEIMSKNGIGNKSQLLYFINLCIVIVFFIGIHPVDLNRTISDIPLQLYSTTHSIFRNSCREETAAKNISSNAIQRNIITALRRMPNFNDRIFSFPGEPIFYVLLNQKPPYYPSIYEATPLFAQQKLIKYIEDEDIEFVVYNANIKSIQDEVPDVIRGRLLYSYIRKNFTVIDNIQGYLILKRNKSEKNFAKNMSL